MKLSPPSSWSCAASGGLGFFDALREAQKLGVLVLVVVTVFPVLPDSEDEVFHAVPLLLARGYLAVLEIDPENLHKGARTGRGGREEYDV